MKPIVYLGPTLSLEDAREIVDADFLPPCKMADVYHAVKDKPAAILIIDGLFERQPAVWHKEILFALSEGVPVLGASSMGALRAVELSSFGMVGIGSIYNMYASGEINDDDEVAVVHASAEDAYMCISEALVNIRYGLRLAVDEGVIGEVLASQLIEQSKSRYYPERCWEAVFGDCRALASEASADKLRSFISAIRPNLKRNDAIEALKRLNTYIGNESQDSMVPFKLEQTCYWDELVNYSSTSAAHQESSQNFLDIRNHVRIFESEKQSFLEKSYLLSEAEKRIQSGEITIEKSEMPKLMAGFRRRYKLYSPEDLSTWMSDNKLSKKELLYLIKVESALLQLMAKSKRSVDANLISSLRLHNVFANVDGKVFEKNRLRSKSSINNDYGQDSEAYLEIIRWFQKTYEVIDQSVEEYAISLGVFGENIFLNELIKEYNFSEVKINNGHDRLER